MTHDFWHALRDLEKRDPEVVTRNTFDAYRNTLPENDRVIYPRFENEGYDTILNWDETRWWVTRKRGH